MREPERLLASGATDFERELLQAVKDERPSAELQQRMQRALGLPSGPVPPSLSPTAPPAPAPAGAVLGSGLSGVALKVILGSVVAGGFAYSVVSLTTIEGEPDISAPAAKRDGRAVAAPRRAGAAAASEVSGAGSSEVGARSAPERARADGSEDGAPRAPASSDSLRVEIELLDAVRAASSAGESERAEEALERYDSRFPRGALRREADMLRRSGVKATGAASSAPSRGADPEAASGR